MRPRWTLGLLALHALAPLRHLRMDAWDYDEGPTLQAAALALRGARLYRDVPLNKPPLLVLLLEGSFATTSASVVAGRVTALLLGLASLAALASLAEEMVGSGAGLALLALALFVRDIPDRLAVVMSDLPALGAASLALAAAWRARSPDARRAPLVSGLALAATATLHPLLAGVILAWVVGAWGAPRRRVVVALAVATAATLAVLAPFDGAAMRRWIIDYNRAHLGALEVDHSAETLRRWTRESWPWIAAATASWAWLLRARETRRAGLLSAALTAAIAATLGLWHPLWENYRLWIELTLALPVACALATLKGRARYAWVAVPALAVLSQRPAWPAWTPERVAARTFLAALPASTAVLSDDPFLAFAAGRLVPPRLADTSFKRGATGYLTLAEVRAEAASRDAAVVFATGRFDRLPGLRAWAEARATRTLRAGAVSVYVLPR